MFGFPNMIGVEVVLLILLYAEASTRYICLKLVFTFIVDVMGIQVGYLTYVDSTKHFAELSREKNCDKYFTSGGHSCVKFMNR